MKTAQAAALLDASRLQTDVAGRQVWAVVAVWWCVVRYAELEGRAVVDCELVDCAAWLLVRYVVADCDYRFLMDSRRCCRAVFARVAGVVGAGLRREDAWAARSCLPRLLESRV